METKKIKLNGFIASIETSKADWRENPDMDSVEVPCIRINIPFLVKESAEEAMQQFIEDSSLVE